MFKYLWRMLATWQCRETWRRWCNVKVMSRRLEVKIVPSYHFHRHNVNLTNSMSDMTSDVWSSMWSQKGEFDKCKKMTGEAACDCFGNETLLDVRKSINLLLVGWMDWWRRGDLITWSELMIIRWGTRRRSATLPTSRRRWWRPIRSARKLTESVASEIMNDEGAEQWDNVIIIVTIMDITTMIIINITRYQEDIIGAVSSCSK